jgi:cytochrome c biogenesis protein CcdA
VSELAVAAASALWLGILTSISPCPLATNIAAVSFLGRRVDKPRLVFGGGLLYALGRALAYVALGAFLLAGLMSAPGVSSFLQRHINRIVGPLLVVVGLFLLELIRVRLPGLGRSGERLQNRLESRGMWGAVPLGALFALSFCPVVMFAVLVAAGARGVGLAFKRVTLIERWVRRILAVIFIGVGIYMTLSYTFELGA